MFEWQKMHSVGCVHRILLPQRAFLNRFDSKVYFRSVKMLWRSYNLLASQKFGMGACCAF